MLRQIEINDTLPDRIESAIKLLKELIAACDFKEGDSLPCLSNDLNCDGEVHDIVDSMVPIYTKEIDEMWFLHRPELEAAYDNAGAGDNPWENYGMAAVYYLIYEKLNDWYQNHGQEYFDSLIKKRNAQ